ncbi:VanZ family protein [bacterium]|nr:VanZ family protein [bacterium]
MISKAQKNQLFYLVLTMLWGYFIFYLSSIPDLSSGLGTVYDLVLRKLAHIFVYAVLTYFVSNSLGYNKRAPLLFVIVAVMAYAITDEIHQAGIGGRLGSHKDIIIDSFGVFIGMLCYKYKFKRKTKNPS